MNGVNLKNRKISSSPHNFSNIILLKNFHQGSCKKMDKNNQIVKPYLKKEK